MHTGYCRPTASPPPPAIQELRATIRVLPPQDCKDCLTTYCNLFYCYYNFLVCVWVADDKVFAIW